MNKRKIIIDVATIYPGKGGAGGGIWSYARNLLIHLDEQCTAAPDLAFVVLVNKEFQLPLQHIQVVVVPGHLQRFLFRFLYVHLYLPLYVLWHKALLHKVYFEVPLFCPAPLLVTIHDCMGNFYAQKKYSGNKGRSIKELYFNYINRVAIRRSDMICTPSAAIKNELVANFGIAADKVVVTPLAATAIGPAVTRKKSAGRSLHLYCIAAFHRHKGHLRLIDIVEALHKNHGVDVHLFFRGHVHDTAYFEQVQAAMNASNIRDRLHIVAYQAKSTLEGIYSDADWVVLLSEYEGFGLPLIEAQASGTPVICSDIPVFREVAGDSAFFIQEQWNATEAAAVLAPLLQQTGASGELTTKGFDNLARYSWQKFAAQMLQVYNHFARQKLPLAQPGGPPQKALQNDARRA